MILVALDKRGIKCIFFSDFSTRENICCCDALETLNRGASNEYKQRTFLRKTNKIKVNVFG